MIQLFGLLLIAGLLPALGGELTKKEIKTLKAEVEKIHVATQKRQLGPVLDKTHPALFKQYGGREVIEGVMKQAFEMFEKADMEFLGHKLKKPTQTYDAGEEEICFLPQESTMKVGGQKVKSVGYMVCIRKKPDGDWLFLDGSGMRDNKEMLWTMFPDLPKDIKLPPNTVAVVPVDGDE